MDISADNPRRSVPRAELVDEALGQIRDKLSDVYYALYGERTVDARAALTGSMLAFVFDAGLSPADEWLLLNGRGERVREFRQNFFEVVSDEMVGVVGELTGVPVTYSFFGFDPTTRTTLSIFVLDTRGPDDQQATSEVHDAIAAQMEAKRDEVRTETAADRAAGRSADPTSE